MKNIPERIYLQVDADGELPEDFKECYEVSWCADKIFDTDLVYYLEGNNKNHILSEEEFMKKISSSPLNKFRSSQFKKGMYAGYLETLK